MQGIILGHSDGAAYAYAYVLTDGGVYVHSREHAHLPIGTIVDLSVPVPAAHKPLRVRFAAVFVAAACAVLVLFSGVSAYYLGFDAYYISVDINPSVEASFNRFKFIKSLRGLNKDGDALAKLIDASGNPEEILRNILLCAADNDYLKDDAMIIVGVANNSLEESELMAQELTALTESTPYSENIIIIAGTLEDHKNAAGYGVSLGKLLMAERIVDVENMEIPLSQLVQMPVQDMIDTVDATTEH